MNLLLVYPMFAMVVLIMVVSGIMITNRIRSVRRGDTRAGYFKTYSEGTPNLLERKVSRHYSNLFEIPVLYYAVCTIGIFRPMTSSAFLICAWLFVAARVLHAFIHIGPNRIYPRIAAFVLSWVFLLALWLQLILSL